MAKKTQKAYLNFGGKSYPVEISIYGQVVSAKPDKSDFEQIKQFVNTGKARTATSADRKRARDTYKGKAAMEESALEEMAAADLEGIDLGGSPSSIAKKYVKNYKERTSKPFTKQALSAMKKSLSKEAEDDVVADAVSAAEGMVEAGAPKKEGEEKKTSKKKSSIDKTKMSDKYKKAVKDASEVDVKYGSGVVEEILNRSGILEERACAKKKEKQELYSKKTDGYKCKYCAEEFKSKKERDKHMMACSVN